LARLSEDALRLAKIASAVHIQERKTVGLLAGLLSLALAIVGYPACAQTAKSSPSPAASATGEQIFADLVKHNELRNAALQQYSATRTYAVSDSSGKVHAKETVRMEYIAPDKKSFVTLDEEGSVIVRHLVLNRLMESEVSTAAGADHRDSSITPANYTFRLLGEENIGSHHCFVVEAVPKRKDKYLFEGKVWIDSREFAIVRVAGHPAKNLSFWVTRADFVRQYEKVNDFWLPQKDETTVDVRMYGRKILSIDHHIDTVNRVLSSNNAAPSGIPGGDVR
jgi:outer membrane lipoprotein-sorting protein